MLFREQGPVLSVLYRAVLLFRIERDGIQVGKHDQPGEKLIFLSFSIRLSDLSRRPHDSRVDVTSSLLGARKKSMRTPKSKRKTPTRLPQLCQMYLERLRIILESQRGHGIQNVLSPDRLAFLHVAFFGGFRGDEADELGDAFLDAFFGVFGDFGGGGHGLFHDTGDVGDLEAFGERDERGEGGLRGGNGLVLCTLPPLVR
jgi:hypothetical protein